MVQAQQKDLDTVLKILVDAGIWLETRGITNRWAASTLSRTEFEKRIRQGEIYLATIDERPIGTITLQTSDMDYWGVNSTSDALYVHKLAVNRDYAGKKIGAKMLEWSGQLARSMSKEFLRLDCDAGDRKIRDYYEKLGFTYLRDVPAPFGWTVSLFEKDLTING
jgi:GNAT superfamily N-acetyltransferase